MRLNICHVPFHLELYWSILFNKSEHLSWSERSLRSFSTSVRLLPKERIGVIHKNSGICIHLVHDDSAQSNLHDCRCLPTIYFLSKWNCILLFYWTSFIEVSDLFKGEKARLHLVRTLFEVRLKYREVLPRTKNTTITS